jgi:hypothetical protein
VPSWGRPPGAKGSKRRRRWEQEQEASQGVRIEELDSDDTDSQGVGLNFDQKRIVYDSLHFLGASSSSQPRVRKGYAYNSDTSESESDSEDGGSAMQVALRDKEEALVQSALARIRRAQEKGKSQVKLNPEELEALERRRQRMQAAAKKEKGSGPGSGSERKRRSERLISVPIAEPPSRTKGKSKRAEDFDPRASGSSAPPGVLVRGADGVYAPVGYYPQQSASSRNSPTRPRSSTSLAYPQGQPRHYSDGTRPTSSSSNGSRRPLPDEEDWVPNSRRSSLSSQSHNQDPFDYQVDNGHPPPIPQQYIQTRRIVSGPPEIMYSTLPRNPPSFSSSSREHPAEPSRRKSLQRDSPENIATSSDEEEDESDDLNNGVQVFVEEREPTKERTVPRKPVGGRKKDKGR